MAQDIIIAGAQYPEVPAINIPKTAGGTALFVDTSEDTITAEKLRSGITAHDKSGEKITGTLPEVVQATPIIGVDAMGKITAYASQKAGVVTAGTKYATMQLPTQEPIEIIPSSSRQTAVEKGIFTTGFVTVAAVYAVIGVTYPAGSTCTCTNGETTLTAEDTSGKAMFIISEAGTWTVKAVSGDKTASSTVEITAEGQVKTVEINFELVLFDGSTGTVASGYSWVGHDILHDDSYGQGYYLPFYGYGGGSGGNISPMIDVSNYSTLKIKACLVGSAMVGTGYGAIGLYKTLPTFTDANPAPVAGIRIGAGQSSQPAGLPAAQEYTVDISALSGEYYFAGISLGWNPAALQVELS